MNHSTYRFAAFLLDPAARELRRGDERVALPPKSLECLTYLVGHRDRAVGRDELISAVWGRVDVSDALLAQTLLRARRAVGDSGNDQTSIRTVPRFGYQWVATTEVIDPGALPTHSTATAAAAGDTATRTDAPPPSRRTRGRAVALAVLAAAAFVFIGFAWRSEPATPPAARNLLVVAPVSLPGGGGDASWVRLGVMDDIAARLRDAGLTVLPSERVAGLVAERGDEPPDALHAHLRRASGVAAAAAADRRRVVPRPQPFAVAEASLSFCAHSSQQTSTVLPPIFTLMRLSSSG